MRRALLISVLLIIVLGAAWAVRELSDQPTIVSPPAQIALETPEPTPTPAPLPPLPQQQPPAAATPTPPTPAQSTTYDVQFDLLDEKHQSDVGARLTLKKGREEVSGLVDVTGAVRLPLTDGVWTVVAPERTFPPQLEVTATTRRVLLERLNADELAVSGVVLNELGLPVPSATVISGVHAVLTDTNGEFQLLVPGVRAAEVVASNGAKRSRPVRAVAPNASVSLKLESAVEYEVEVIGPGAATASGVVFSDQVLTCPEFPCRVQVLRGQVRLLATSFNAGVLCVARKTNVIEDDKKHSVRLVLKPAQPFRGKLVDARTGVPLPGVDVRLVPWPTSPDLAVQGSATQSTTDGAVSAAWPSNAQFFNVLVGPLYRVEKEIIVSPGDAPITISVVPVQSVTSSGTAQLQ